MMDTMLRISFLLLGTLAVYCNAQAESYPGCGEKIFGVDIIGGDNAYIDQWPWQAAVTINRAIGFDTHVCGGTLIHPEWVLTAAHCVLNWHDPAPYAVYLGTSYRSAFNESSVVVADVANLYIHPDYDVDSYANDIALIQFDAPVNISSRFVTPACVPESTSDYPVGSNCWVTGWGSAQSGDTPSERLQGVSLPIISNGECEALLEPGEILTDDMICTLYSDGGTCLLDGGGPLSCEDETTGKWFVAGIASRGNACLQENKPGIFTKVSSFRDSFIQNVFDGTIPPTKPYTCGNDEYQCEGGLCLNELATRCNLVPDCPNLDDESYCSREWQLFRPTYSAITSSLSEVGKVFNAVLQDECMRLCLNETSFVCRAFDYVTADGTCHLINTANLPVQINTTVAGVEHWDLRSFQDCGAYFLGLDGFIGSPRYMTTRPNEFEWCQITIANSQFDAVIQLNVSSVMTQPGGVTSCDDVFDRLVVYDGNSIDAPVVGVYCLGNLPSTIRSTTNTMTLEYTEDPSLVETQGFITKYLIRYYQETDITEGPGNITSPLYPNNYPPEREYHWTITAPQGYHVRLDFLVFQLEEDDEVCSGDKDHLSLFWGTSELSPHFGTFCGSLFISQSIESPGRYVHLQFKSDSQNEYKGFQIEYFFVQDV